MTYIKNIRKVQQKLHKTRGNRIFQTLLDGGKSYEGNSD